MVRYNVNVLVMQSPIASTFLHLTQTIEYGILFMSDKSKTSGSVSTYTGYLPVSCVMRNTIQVFFLARNEVKNVCTRSTPISF